jgi:transposase
VERRIRRWRSVAEKRRIVELTFEPGASVALVARANGVNANQVFKWRRALDRGELVDPAAGSTALLPVTLSAACETAIEPREDGMQEQPPQTGSIHIELPGRAMISVECGADPALLRSVLESLRK